MINDCLNYSSSKWKKFLKYGTLVSDSFSPYHFSCRRSFITLIVRRCVLKGNPEHRCGEGGKARLDIALSKISGGQPSSYAIDLGNVLDCSFFAQMNPQAAEEEQEIGDDDCDCQFTFKVHESEWDELQKHADIAFVAWVSLFGGESVFNYMHFLGSGHFSDQGKAFSNLATLANQVRIS